jgi:hypothetical protein
MCGAGRLSEACKRGGAPARQVNPVYHYPATVQPHSARGGESLFGSLGRPTNRSENERRRSAAGADRRRRPPYTTPTSLAPMACNDAAHRGDPGIAGPAAQQPRTASSACRAPRRRHLRPARPHATHQSTAVNISVRAGSQFFYLQCYQIPHAVSDADAFPAIHARFGTSARVPRPRAGPWHHSCCSMERSGARATGPIGGSAPR